ncbi:MAG: hypothetical protein AABY10_03920, partial [Nanoarchaeota archaeon]
MDDILMPATELRHPGYVVFEGLDFTGKTYLAKRASIALRKNEEFRLNVRYNHNHGFIRKDLVDEKTLRSLGSRERAKYLLEMHKSDSLPYSPSEFSEIFQDRSFIYTLFYGISRGFYSLDNIPGIIRSFSKPKHLFIVECSYEERVRRAKQKEIVKEEEIRTLESISKHEELTRLYRNIANSTGIPYTIVNTTNMSDHDINNSFLTLLQEIRVFEHLIPLETIVDDTEKSVFKSTLEFKVNHFLEGNKLKPIRILRKIDGNKKYINLIRDG